MGWKLMLPTLIFISAGFRKLPWPTIIGLYSLIYSFLRRFMTVAFVTSGVIANHQLQLSMHFCCHGFSSLTGIYVEVELPWCGSFQISVSMLEMKLMVAHYGNCDSLLLVFVHWMNLWSTTSWMLINIHRCQIRTVEERTALKQSS